MTLYLSGMIVDGAFVPVTDQRAYLKQIEKTTEKRIDQLLTLHGSQSELDALSTTNEVNPWDLPAPQKISAEDFPFEMNLVLLCFLIISLGIRPNT